MVALQLHLAAIRAEKAPKKESGQSLDEQRGSREGAAACSGLRGWRVTIDALPVSGAEIIEIHTSLNFSRASSGGGPSY